MLSNGLHLINPAAAPTPDIDFLQTKDIWFVTAEQRAIRYRYYPRWGLTPGDVVKVIILPRLTVGLGLGTLRVIGLMV